MSQPDYLTTTVSLRSRRGGCGPPAAGRCRSVRGLSEKPLRSDQSALWTPPIRPGDRGGDLRVSRSADTLRMGAFIGSGDKSGWSPISCSKWACWRPIASGIGTRLARMHGLTALWRLPWRTAIRIRPGQPDYAASSRLRAPHGAHEGRPVGRSTNVERAGRAFLCQVRLPQGGRFSRTKTTTI